MPWAATDVRFIRDARGTSAEAKVLFHAARLYCSERETDGVFSRAQLLALAEEAEVSDPIKHAAIWVKRGLWEKTSDGWLDVGFAAINASHEAREKERQRLRDYRRRQKEHDPVQRSRTPYAYTPTGQDRTDKQDVAMKNNSSVVLEMKHPRRRGSGSSQGISEREIHDADDAIIDAHVALAARDEARERKGLLARARLYELASRPVKGLRPQVQQ